MGVFLTHLSIHTGALFVTFALTDILGFFGLLFFSFKRLTFQKYYTFFYLQQSSHFVNANLFYFFLNKKLRHAFPLYSNDSNKRATKK